MNDVKKHPAAEAWDQWIESDKGKALRKAYDFTEKPGGSQFLENRLHWAFMAGWDAAQKARQR